MDIIKNCTKAEDLHLLHEEMIRLVKKGLWVERFGTNCVEELRSHKFRVPSEMTRDSGGSEFWELIKITCPQPGQYHEQPYLTLRALDGRSKDTTVWVDEVTVHPRIQ